MQHVTPRAPTADAEAALSHLLLDLPVHPLHHAIALRVKRRGENIVNIKQAVHVLLHGGRELGPSVLSDSGWHTETC